MRKTTATFTTSTVLQPKDNTELIDYLRSYASEYSKNERFVWHRITRNKGCAISQKSSLNTEIQNRFGVTKRTANSMIMDMTGRYNALVELKQTELTSLEAKIESYIKKLNKLEISVSNMSVQASLNALTEAQLSSYRVKKHTLFAKHQRLAKMKDRYVQLTKDIEASNYKLAFGGKKTFQAQYHLTENGYRSHEGWKNDYIRKRDSNILYVGSSDELCGNQLFQLTNIGDDEYIIKVRKDGSFASKKPNDKANYVFGKCRIKYMNAEIKSAIQNGSGPLTYRIKFKQNRVYIQIMITLKPKEDVRATTTKYGVLGLDFNDGHIDLSETDEHGNLVYMTQYRLRHHGTGNRALNEMRQVANEIGKYANETGKTIVREDLKFIKKKSKTQKAKSKQGKEYNRMIHTLDYSRYNDCFNNMTFRRGIGQILVNPAYTSQIAKQKYCKDRKLLIHNGAAYVIGRRGQGFKDKLPPKTKKQAIETKA